MSHWWPEEAAPWSEHAGMENVRQQTTTPPVLDKENIGTNNLRHSPVIFDGATKLIKRGDGALDNYLFDLLTQATPMNSEHLLHRMMRDYIKADLEVDQYGNMWCIIGDNKTPEVMFSCHMDTVHPKPWMLSLFRTTIKDMPMKDDFVFAGRFVKNKGEKTKLIACNLGADDKVGIYIMSNMINAKVPGLYVFHMGEEHGCKGSGNIVKNHLELPRFKKLKKVIAFDRKGYGDVINHQGSSCCSSEFANALALELNNKIKDEMPGELAAMFKYKPAGGVYTDSAEYRHDVSECTNLSVGYFLQHFPTEHMDPHWLEMAFLPAVFNVDWQGLPAVRNPHYVPPVQNYTSTYQNNMAATCKNYKTLDLFPFEDCIMYGEVTDTTADVDLAPLPLDMGVWFEKGQTPQSQDAVARILRKTNSNISQWNFYQDAPKHTWQLLQAGIKRQELLIDLIKKLAESDGKDGVSMPDWFYDVADKVKDMYEPPEPPEPAQSVGGDKTRTAQADAVAIKLHLMKHHYPSNLWDRWEKLWNRFDAIQEDYESLEEAQVLTGAEAHIDLANDMLDAEIAIDEVEIKIKSHEDTLLGDTKHINVPGLLTAFNTAMKAVIKVSDALYNAETGFFNDEKAKYYLAMKAKAEAEADTKAEVIVPPKTDPPVLGPTSQLPLFEGDGLGGGTAMATAMFPELSTEQRERVAALTDPAYGVPRVIEKRVTLPKTETIVVNSKGLEAQVKDAAKSIEPVGNFHLLNIKIALTNTIEHLEKGRRLMAFAGEVKDKSRALELNRQAMQENSSAIQIFNRGVLTPHNLDHMPIDLRNLITRWDTGYMQQLETYISMQKGTRQ